MSEDLTGAMKGLAVAALDEAQMCRLEGGEPQRLKPLIVCASIAALKRCGSQKL